MPTFGHLDRNRLNWKSKASAELFAFGGEGCALVRIHGEWWRFNGPFERAERPEGDGFALYLEDFEGGSAKPWLVPDSVSRCKPVVSSRGAEVDWEPVADGEFTEIFADVHAAVESGEIEKAVPVVVERGTVRGGDIAASIAGAFAMAGEHLWPYCWFDGKRGQAGLTPEELFSVEDGVLRTMAVAGTARSGELDAFLDDAKEHAEHELVVSDLSRKLAAFGEVTRGERETVDLGGLVHFVTRFTVALDPGAAADEGAIVRALHPTAAVGVLPSNSETRKRLGEWRERAGVPAAFAAPFGVRWPGGFRALVAIRGVFWEEDRVMVPAGCGIVEGSRLERERDELRRKREWVKAAFRIGGDE